mmetsp:Transcript_29596/g.92424  ORF Transcript_29596/g.92424 Transcript_29596/m.92424 type:complete len:441 (+) Transcript_29596:55-1377(+)
MGSTVSDLVCASDLVYSEQLNWVKNHSLEIDVNLQARQLPLLQNFGQRLFLCSKASYMMGMRYFHYFVTDHTWTIEFGGGESLMCAVLVHNNPMGSYEEEKSIRNAPDVIARMQKVCGARGYSVCLRNCEHLARYILAGSWASMQMLQNGNLQLEFARFMMQQHKAMVNALPLELAPSPTAETLFPGCPCYLQYVGSPNVLNKADQSAFNILVIGPTGSGKSRLINMLYNQVVCESNASAQSVTKNVQLTAGTGSVYGQRRSVNVIDTIGFCDTTIQASEVFRIVKSRVETTCMHIDRVLVVCSGRIEGEHVASIKKVMEWLRFPQYQWNFTFIYNKADQLTPEECQDNLVTMCTLLETGNYHFRYEFPQKWIPSVVLRGEEVSDSVVRMVKTMRITCGFPPCAKYETVEDDLHNLLDNVFFAGRGMTRIPVEESWCPIL